MTETKTWTIKQLLEWTSGHFADHGSDSSRLDAEVLLAQAVGCKRIELYTQFDQVPHENVLSVFRDWVKRRAGGEPVAYLVGHKEFYSLKFEVNSNVLIPRPETEHVVVKAVELAGKMTPPIRIVDVGTGSGCIAVAIGKHIPNSTIVACDISPDALSVADNNIAAHGLQNQIATVHSDLFDSVEGSDFDLIVSNPPYIGTLEENTVEPAVRTFEPAVALFAGESGMEVIRKLVAQSAARLKVGGYLIFETSPLIMDQCIETVASQSDFEPPDIVKDYASLARVVVARRK